MAVFTFLVIMARNKIMSLNCLGAELFPVEERDVHTALRFEGWGNREKTTFQGNIWRSQTFPS